MTRTVVIGAGVAGLATATLLAREGHDVILLERLDRIGGRAGTLERDGFRFDTGPSWYLMPSVYDHFFAMAGTSTEAELDLRTLDPGYRVFREPRSAADPAQVMTVPWGRERVRDLFEELEPGSGRAFDAYLDSAEKASAMAERRFLYNPFTRKRSLFTGDVLAAAPRLASLLGTSLERFVARRFRDPLLRQILGYPAVFLATRPSDAPAIYHLMSSLDLDDGVLYPMGGMWTLIERLRDLAERNGVTIVTGAEVLRIETAPREGKRAVSGVTWRDGARARHSEAADIVVSGADLHHTETQLLASEDRSYDEDWWSTKVSGPGAVLVMLGVRGELPQLAHHSLFFTRDWTLNFDAIFGDDPHTPDPASIYVCKPSETDSSVAPAGHENLFILVPVHADLELGRGGADGTGDAMVERIADNAIAQVAAWANVPDLASRVVVRQTVGPRDFAEQYHSWRGGMLGPAHTLRQSAMFRAQNASPTVAGLYYAGATTAPGVGVPMCLISAELVLKHIRGDRTAGPLPVPRAAPIGS